MRALLFVTLAGCSYFATEGPAPAPGPTKCNRARTPVVMDAVVAVGAALASAVSAREHGGTADVLAPAAVSGVFATSAAYGAFQIGRCRSAHELRPQWSLADMPAVM